jgi:hypothetical protein
MIKEVLTSQLLAIYGEEAQGPIKCIITRTSPARAYQNL